MKVKALIQFNDKGTIRKLDEVFTIVKEDLERLNNDPWCKVTGLRRVEVIEEIKEEVKEEPIIEEPITKTVKTTKRKKRL